MDHQTIRQQMPSLVAGHVSSNARSFQFNIFDGTPKENMLGFRIDPSPFEGKVIATTENAVVIKIGRTKFRSEEHTSELQSLMRIYYAVFCLKKKNIKTNNTEH